LLLKKWVIEISGFNNKYKMKGHEKLRHNSSKVNVDDNGKTPKLRSLYLKLEKEARTKIVACSYLTAVFLNKGT
jgi:hypothetical protein